MDNWGYLSQPTYRGYNSIQIHGWGAPCIVLIGHLPSGFYEQIAIMEHLLIMSSLVQHKFNTR